MDKEDVILLGSLSGGPFFSSGSLGCHVFAGKVGILAFRRFRILWNRRPNNSRLYFRLNQVKAHIRGCLFCHEIFLFVSYGREVYPLAFSSSKLIDFKISSIVESHNVSRKRNIYNLFLFCKKCIGRREF